MDQRVRLIEIEKDNSVMRPKDSEEWNRGMRLSDLKHLGDCELTPFSLDVDEMDLLEIPDEGSISKDPYESGEMQDYRNPLLISGKMMGF